MRCGRLAGLELDIAGRNRGLIPTILRFTLRLLPPFAK